MRRFLLILILCTSAAFAAPTLDKLENSLFGFTYPNETEILRLDRIETEVYGGVNKGDIAQRMAKLNKDLAAAAIGKEIPPKEDSFAGSTHEAARSFTTAEPEPAAPNSDYPAVNALEQVVFDKEFKDKSLNTRLAALEQKTFKKTYASDDLSTRVDRLQSELGTSKRVARNNFDDVELPRNSYNVYQPPSTSSTKSPLTTIEKNVLKQSYPQDNLDSRLARLESSMFGATFDNDSQQERIDRITSANNAQKSARKYDSNKFSQAMSTGMQVGMFILMVLACIL
jgi:hypothetical protein